VALLEIAGLNVRFGGSVALQHVDLTAEAGAITGLIGPNGAGKTTLFNCVTGLLTPNGGVVRLAGRELNRLSPSRRARLGIARTFQRLELFTSLSVRDNVVVAGQIRRRWSRRSDPDPALRHGDVHRRADELLTRLGLADVADREVSEIPTGLARRVEVARALMTGPRLLLLDEPASGQDERETEEFAGLLRDIAAGGTAILLVEHDIALVSSVCDVVHVLDFGRIIASGRPDEVRADRAVIEAYLGADA